MSASLMCGTNTKGFASTVVESLGGVMVCKEGLYAFSRVIIIAQQCMASAAALLEQVSPCTD